MSEQRGNGLLHLRFMWGQGQRSTSTLKTWWCGSGLRWELRRLLPPVGFNETKNTHLSRHVAEHWPRWLALSAFLDLCPPALGLSRHALLKKDRAANVNGAEQECWVSTPMLVVLLLSFHSARRRISDRQKSSAMLMSILEATIPAQWLQGAENLLELSEDTLNRCSAEPVHEGQCVCVRHASMKAPHEPTPHSQLHAVLQHLFEHNHCDALRHRLKQLVTSLTEAAESTFEEWANQDWHRCKDAMLQCRARNRRTDFHVKQFVLRQSREAGLTNSVGQACKSLGAPSCVGVKWREREMNAYRATTLKAFASEPTIAICVDAARVGRPARDYLVGLCTAPRGGIHAALPPQVLFSMKLANNRPTPPSDPQTLCDHPPQLTDFESTKLHRFGAVIHTLLPLLRGKVQLWCTLRNCNSLEYELGFPLYLPQKHS